MNRIDDLIRRLRSYRVETKENFDPESDDPVVELVATCHEAADELETMREQLVKAVER